MSIHSLVGTCHLPGVYKLPYMDDGCPGSNLSNLSILSTLPSCTRLSPSSLPSLPSPLLPSPPRRTSRAHTTVPHTRSEARWFLTQLCSIRSSAPTSWVCAHTRRYVFLKRNEKVLWLIEFDSPMEPVPSALACAQSRRSQCAGREVRRVHRVPPSALRRARPPSLAPRRASALPRPRPRP
jgi:hypothetical protein